MTTCFCREIELSLLPTILLPSMSASTPVWTTCRNGNDSCPLSLAQLFCWMAGFMVDILVVELLLVCVSIAERWMESEKTAAVAKRRHFAGTGIKPIVFCPQFRADSLISKRLQKKLGHATPSNDRGRHEISTKKRTPRTLPLLSSQTHGKYTHVRSMNNARLLHKFFLFWIKIRTWHRQDAIIVSQPGPIEIEQK